MIVHDNRYDRVEAVQGLASIRLRVLDVQLVLLCRRRQWYQVLFAQTTLLQ